MTITILGNPATKKNSMDIFYTWVTRNGKRVKGRPFIAQNKRYKDYEKLALSQLKGIINMPIDIPVNVKCIYYRKTMVRCDQSNLIACTDDVLVKAGILKDDNFRVIVAHDGSRVRFDPLNPRVEITITPMEDNDG